MDKIKAGRPTIELIKLCYHANQPLLLCGCHGIGKSDLLACAAKDMGLNFISRDLSLMESPDLVGLPKMDGETTRYLPPSFLPATGGGLLVFEEINRADRYSRSPCLQLLTARTLNDYRLPNGWLPMAAINPASEDYEVFDLDGAMLSRFVQVTVVPDQAEWLDWAQNNDIHPAVLDYVASDTTIFDSTVSNPRAWTYTSNVLRAADKLSVDRKVIRAAIIGLVGDQRGVAFWRTLKRTDRPLTADKILGGYSRHRAAIGGWVKEGRTDLLENTLLAVKKYLQPRGDFEQVKADSKRWKNFGAFLDDLPGDLRQQMEQWLQERGYDIPLPSKKRVKTS